MAKGNLMSTVSHDQVQNALEITETVSGGFKDLEMVLKSLPAHHLSGGFLSVPIWLN